MPIFICPNCGNRLNTSERTAGFRTTPRGCDKCGFGFVFELLDDYFPDPNAAFFVCDREARVIGCGKGSFELTGLDDERAVGRPVRELLGLRFENGGGPDRDHARMGREGDGQARARRGRGRPARGGDGGRVSRL